ncbi:predicted protein [Plenodomus lingam JN3]|uniref:Uncharacterized protein n=1 Tax=Leptosphaeria maculans (strain JN3 / isolate v23.1.3 / race Av1-4-5-6-7-8) TaxID=985895 RepID=E4ZGP9_LEPMJ|nr:predicted protein [Plenodomus lingam JN3]CBX90469.1 predicted protein [Plenodomus lingam JN3]
MAIGTAYSQACGGHGALCVGKGTNPCCDCDTTNGYALACKRLKLSKRMRIVALVMQRAINVVDKIHRMNYSAVRSVKKRADNVDRYLPLDLSGTPLLLQHDPLRTRQFKVNFSLYEFPQPLAVKYITPTLNAPIIAI